MAKSSLLPALFLLAGAPGLEAQTDYYARVGVIGASKLTHDVIVNEVTVRQSIAPMIALGAAVPVGTGYRAGLEAILASGSYHSEENGAKTDLGTVRTGSLMLGLDGPITSSFRWRAGLGAILYWPSEDEGIFLQGGPTKFLAGIGVDYRYPLMTKWDLMASARYDYHRFTTDELERRGFSQTQPVNRISLSVGLARGHR
jgi:hypothetical protein